MVVPLTRDVPHYRGDTLVLQVRLWEDTARTVPSDLTAALVAAQVRAFPDALVELVAFAVDVAGNEITLRLTGDQTQVLPPVSSYDCEVDWYGDQSRVQTVMAGKIGIVQDVTRA